MGELYLDTLTAYADGRRPLLGAGESLPDEMSVTGPVRPAAVTLRCICDLAERHFLDNSPKGDTFIFVLDDSHYRPTVEKGAVSRGTYQLGEPILQLLSKQQIVRTCWYR